MAFYGWGPAAVSSFRVVVMTVAFLFLLSTFQPPVASQAMPLLVWADGKALVMAVTASLVTEGFLAVIRYIFRKKPGR